MVPFLLLACLGWSSVAAADPGQIDPEAQRQQNEARQKEVDGEIDELTASDDALKAELDKLDVRVHAEEANAAEAQSGLDALQVQLGQLDRQVIDAEQLAAQARRDAADRAVAAYIRPDRETASQVLAAKNPQQLGTMHALVSDVVEYNHSVLLNRITTENDVKRKKAEVQEGRDRASQLTVEAQNGVAEAARLRDRQVAVRAELEKRIENLHAEAMDLDLKEAELTALLNARSSAVAADPSLAAGPDGATAPTTTAAPPTTVPAPTTTAAPGTPTTVAPSTTRPPPTTSPPTTRPPSGSSLSWPLSGPLTSPFGARWGTFHAGIDVGVPTGTPIHAAAGGVVFFSGVISGYGNVVLIDHGGGMVTLYAHQSQLIAAQGQRVSTGTLIGLVGSTGNSTGPHLHFEVRINNVAVDPLSYLP